MTRRLGAQLTEQKVPVLATPRLGGAACANETAVLELDRLLIMDTTQREMEAWSQPFIQQYCWRCPVLKACADDGVRLGYRGVWGGRWRNRVLR